MKIKTVIYKEYKYFNLIFNFMPLTVFGIINLSNTILNLINHGKPKSKKFLNFKLT